MKGRDFLDVARDVVAGSTEAYWRAAVVDSYYALMLECRDALFRWGFPLPPHQNVHSWVRLRFTYAADADLKRIGDALDKLGQFRNLGSYHLNPSPEFSSDKKARGTIQRAADALSLLDAIDSYSVRRAAAIAAIHP